MANIIAPSLRANLSRLKHAGNVNGIGLAWRRQSLVNMMPFEPYRVDSLIQVLRDARLHFQNGSHDRNIETFWMGFEHVHLLTIFSGDVTLFVLHQKMEEADFIQQAALTCLEDCQLLIDSALHSNHGDSADELSQLEDPDQPIIEPSALNPHQTHVMS